jgi:uncharacterized protein (TIGR03435 family)
LQNYQIDGGPSWVEIERYEIKAKSPAPATREQMLVMLQALLSERFQLAFHRTTKPLLMNLLTIAKGGPKFGSQFHPAVDGQSAAPSYRVDQLQFPNVTMKAVCPYLRLNFRRDLVSGKSLNPADIPPVLDQTELSGSYDIILNSSSHEEWSELLQHQLGLRLDQRKVPTEVLVIDAATKPPAN